MTHRTCLVAALAVAAILATSPPAAADSTTDSTGFHETTVCVTSDSPGRGYRIGAAIRGWNAAQQSVHLTQTPVPGCATLVIRFVTPAEAPCWPCGGYELNGDTEYSEVWQRWAYHDSFIGLVDADPASRPEKCYALTLVEHEIGHALGLPHSEDRRSVMSSDYNHDRHCGAFGGSDVANVTTLYSA